MKLKDQKVWVVGATGTIGGAIAKKFRDEGAEVITHRVDVCDWEEVKAAAENIRPNILVNCSGTYGPHGGLLENRISEWLHTLDVNLIGSFYLTRAVLPSMVCSKHGKIIHMSGGGAANGRPFYSAYSVSKTALVRFVECIAGEVEGLNIQINAIAPGSIKSRLNPEGTGTPDKAAELALFLATKESNHLSGRLISAGFDNWTHIKDCLAPTWMLRRVPFEEKK